MDLFQMGEEASRGKMTAALEELHQSGQDVIDSMQRQQETVLTDFDRRLGALNARRTRAARVLAPGVVARFLVSDFSDIEQGLTSAAVRIDAGVATLHERGQHTDLAMRSNKFSTSTGTVEQFGSLYRVHVDGGWAPSGTFDIELVAPVRLTMLVFDIAAITDGSQIRVLASADGLEFQPATSVSLAGYRITAWLPEVEAKFLRISILPSHPDGLGGNSYTFGLTAINSLAVDFHLRSELLSRGILFNPRGRQLRFSATDDPGLTYFLSLVEPGQQDQFLEAGSGDVVSVAAVSDVETPGLTGTALQALRLPPDYYSGSLTVVNEVSGKRLPIVYGYDPNNPATSSLQGSYVAVVGPRLYLLNCQSMLDAGTTFALRYSHGPITIQAKLRVVLNTTDPGSSPLFRGAVLEEI